MQLTYPLLLRIFVLALATAFGLSYLARHHWFLDLFSHFAIQYFVAAILFLAACLWLKDWAFAGICLMVIAGAGLALNPKLGPAPENSAAKITVAQYNTLYGSFSYKPMLAWLRKNNFDIVTLQEIAPDIGQRLEGISDIYPYRFPENRMGGADLIFLSRHPILETEILTTGDDAFATYALKIKVQPAGFHEPVSIYSLHAKTPMSKRLQQKRNLQLLDTAAHIRKDGSRLILFMGDWNITPYSPHFKELLEVSGLNHDYSGLWPPTTWPSFLLLPFLKIPIDHVLFSNGFRQIQLKAGPIIGSDHNAIIATFGPEVGND